MVKKQHCNKIIQIVQLEDVVFSDILYSNIKFLDQIEYEKNKF